MKYKNIFISLFFMISVMPTFCFAINTEHEWLYNNLNVKNEEKVNEFMGNRNNETILNSSINLTSEEFSSNKTLMEAALITALNNNDIDSVKYIYEIYKKTKNTDEILSILCKALIMESKYNYKESIKLYQEILNKQPNYNDIHYKLAVLYYTDYQYDNGLHELHQLDTSDAHKKKLIKEYNDQIKDRDQWGVSTNFFYSYEPNINNAPSIEQYKGWEFSKKKSGNAVYGNVNVIKKNTIKNGFFDEFNIGFSGKLYYENSEYNDIESIIKYGFGYRDSLGDVIISPLVKKRWYSNKEYSQGYGVSTSITSVLSDSLFITNNFEFNKEQYNNANWINGNDYLVNFDVYYVFNDDKYIKSGFFYKVKSAKDEDESYNRYGISLGGSKVIYNDINIKLDLMYINQSNKGKDFFLIKRKDKIYLSKVGLSDKSINLFGFIPQVSFIYEKKDSNHPLYENDKMTFLIEAYKKF